MTDFKEATPGALVDNSGARPLRKSVREDAIEARDWARRRGSAACEAIRDEPMRITLYALGIGILIGMIAAR